MWLLTNSELEEETYERKHGLSLTRVKNISFPLVTLNTIRITNPINQPIPVNPSTPIQIDTTPLTPTGISTFYYIEDLQIEYDSLTRVEDPDLIITNNSYYVNYGNLNPYTMVHSNLNESLILDASYTFTFVVPNRNNNYEYVIDLSSFVYIPNTISYIMASGIKFNDIPASEGCPNYFVFDLTNKTITLKGCNSCKPVTGDTATVYCSNTITTAQKYTAYKFSFSSEIGLVSMISYRGKTYNLSNKITNGSLLYNSELSSCLCLSRI